MVDEGRALETVSDSTSCFYTICHAWWTTREDTNLRKKPIFFLEAVEELVEVRTAKVSYGTQTSEETAAGQLLEVPLADVLNEKEDR